MKKLLKELGEEIIILEYNLTLDDNVFALESIGRIKEIIKEIHESL